MYDEFSLITAFIMNKKLLWGFYSRGGKDCLMETSAPSTEWGEVFVDDVSSPFFLFLWDRLIL